jgi:hypothetical protein
MKRHYFISDDIDDLERLETELELGGIATPQIHVLTLDETAAERRTNLNDVQSLMKRDIIRSGEYGFVAGIIGAAAVLLVTYMAGWHNLTQVGWIPFVFLAIIVLGFLTWEGGFIGIQTFNAKFERFKQELEDGKHLFFVDLTEDQEPVLQRVLIEHPTARSAGSGRPTPHWIHSMQQRTKRLFGETLP